jgi:RNA polymerase sigma-70 factor (ECF subfamily)
VDTSPVQLTDEAVAGLVQNGDRDAFGTLVERYEEKLLRYGRKFLARQEDIQDIVQDVFMSTYKNIQSFNTSQKFSPWIYRIAHNAFVNNLRKQSYRPVVLPDFDTLLSYYVTEDPGQKEREQKELREMLDQSLETLPPKYREVLILYYLEEMSYKEIADILQTPQGTVGIRLKRAREALKLSYEKITHGR